MTDPGNFCLFVYGSLRSGFKSPAYDYMSRYFNMVKPGKVRGRLYDLGEYPAAVPGTEDFFILGELYVVKNPNEFPWAMAQVDDYEGVLSENGELPLYRRELAEIILDNETTTAWIYWYNGDVNGKPAVLSGDILEYIKNKS